MIAFVMAAALVLMVPGVGSAADVPAVPLGTAGNYSVLGASTVTNTGNSILHLSVGLWPGTSITGFPPGVVVAPAIIDATSAAAQQAQSDLTVAYVNAAGRSVDGTTAANLGGLILEPGVYAGPSKGALGLTGTLTLDAGDNPNAVFIIQTNSSLTTASNATVMLINGAQECNVYWQVGSSATIGTGSNFAGNIMAQDSITVTTGATLRGRALARTGAVTLDSNTVTVPTCALARLGNIIVDKVTDPAGSNVDFEFAPDWDDNFFLADEDTPYDSGGMAPGTYSVDEVNLSHGWVLDSVTCSDGSNPSSIALGLEETVTCTFNNRQLPLGSLTIIKDARPADNTVFTFDAGTLGTFALEDPLRPSKTFNDVGGQTVLVTEDASAGWAFDRVACTGTDDWSHVGPALTVTVPQDGLAVCTFSNFELGRIIVDKVTDPAGSDIDFEFEPDWDDNFFLTDEDEPYDSGLMAPGTYSVAEVNLPEDWELTSAVCEVGVLNGSVESTIRQAAMDPAAITLGPGETVLCTFTNIDTSVLPPTASLTIIKDARPADNTVFWFDGGSLPGFSLKDPADPSIHFPDLDPGAYIITELTLGLDATWLFEEVTCDALDWSATGRTVTVNLSEGEAAVCTFFNAEELPATGMAPWVIPLGIGGLAALLLGLGLLLARKRQTA